MNVFLREKRNWGNEALLFSKSEPEEMDVPLDDMRRNLHERLRRNLLQTCLGAHGKAIGFGGYLYPEIDRLIAMQKLIGLLFATFALSLTGCHEHTHQTPGYQRFVLVPNPSEINKNIPAGGLALDTKTGQVCYTVGGNYTSEFPAIDMCTRVREANP